MFQRIINAIRQIDLVILIGILLLFLSVLIGVAGYVHAHGDFDVSLFVADYYANISTELGSIAITIILVDQFVRRRDRKEHLKEQFEQALLKLKSGANVLALEALEEMWVHGWLTDGSLRGEDLSRADLRGADLGHADLTLVRFHTRRHGDTKFDNHTRLPDNTYWTPDADLTRFTDPEHPNYWRGYTLWRTYQEYQDYRNANLYSAGLKHSTFYRVNFSGADMRHANFRQANLEDCCLINTRLEGAQFDEDTILPDGEHWTPETDLTRFTNPKNPDFWRLEWVKDAVSNGRDFSYS